ncbi:LexA family transcriptional regulator [Roseospira navarrensis]|nr:LexA family transcriptional regulator [Roseospira navarrensis]
MDTAADRLRRARRQAGFATATDAALALGWNPNTYKSHENGTRGLRGPILERYARGFGVSPAWLQFGPAPDRPASVQNEPDLPPGFGEESSAVRDAPESPGRAPDVDLAHPRTEGLVGARDLPVYGSALGGPDGEMIVSFEPIEWVRRPGPLEGVKGGFGFYMIGESMSPAFEPGDMILCHPTRPPFAGQDVLVIRRQHDGQCALVKRLVRMDAAGLRLRQFNPPHEFDVPSTEVVSFHLVVGKYSRR